MRDEAKEIYKSRLQRPSWISLEDYWQRQCSSKEGFERELTEMKGTW